MITLKENSMIHHVKETFEGIVLGVIGIFNFSISWNTIDNSMKVIAFLLGCICTIATTRYYIKASKKLDKK